MAVAAVPEPVAKRARLDGKSIAVMLSGLPGDLAAESAKACLRAGLEIVPVGLTGPRGLRSYEVVETCGSVEISLVSSKDPDAQRKALLEAIKGYGDRLVVVDCSHPSAVNPNAEMFTSVGCAFVMATTGGNREALMTHVGEGGVYAIIAANMCKQVAALQATMERMATDFPGAFSGYTLDIMESHQKTKVDTSGTARDMVSSFQKLGLDFELEQISKIRDDAKAVEFGVPASAVGGHGFHTYTLRSSDSSVEFQIKHNVCGRRTYGEGVVDAVVFLAAQRAAGSKKKLFSMIDVLESGVMR